MATSSLDQSYIDAIKGSEGYSPQSNWDYKQYSSGYGTKAQPGDENIPPDQRQAVYEQRFQDEIGKAAASVDAFNPNLPPGVRAALTSLTYNAGPGWQQSGLGQAVKAGDWDKAQSIFLQYNHAGGNVDPGLTARRQREAAWFGGQPAAQPQAAPVTPATAPSAPLNIAPQQPPVFAQVPQAAPQGDAGMAAQAPAFQPPQAAQIFYAQRRSPDLSKLRASLAQAPIFSRG
ncbi:lysozyme [Bradyrhizobium phage ppBeUSDA76-2]|uniref:lysozyme n=2 Tax=Bradyrhizobium TaxID=374 RepID=UPI0009B77114|nr:lysozyme [Bradyrhizobium elkanii]WAX24427.1 lysozyme [Bradyrhizobium phage ppBeUSDA76-2]MCP1732414.1 lysozyme [Bradyrhizobium elkanii]MCS3567752.1 lysozyme [Bradyrhizobium elkanii]MCS3590765.1 lysozyme [Bradyrhizobium elkanii]MCS3620208.1 lysozyme [Bradyrhizobium elkanii]